MKDLIINHKEIMKYWDYEQNKKKDIDPSKVGRKSHQKVSWTCSNCGQKFEKALSKTRDNVLCTNCSRKKGLENRIKTYTQKNGSLLDNCPDVINEWDYEKNVDLNPYDITSQSSQKVWWICPNGHSYKSSVSHKVNGRGCPRCSKEKSRSFPEKAIVYYLNKVDNSIIESYQPSFLEGKEIDVFIED